MFYARINKIKVFNNREGFPGLFNRAELRIYGYVTGYFGDTQSQSPSLTLGDLANLPDEARRKRLLEAVIDKAGKLSQSVYMEIDRVKDNQSITFGGCGHGALSQRADSLAFGYAGPGDRVEQRCAGFCLRA